jgi:CRISPR/Cas system-associated protein Csm6
MTYFLLIAMIALLIVFYLYEEHRKKLRIPIVILLAIVLLSFVSTSFRCALNLSPTTLASFNWQTISFQHEMCTFGDAMRQMSR